MKEIEIWKECLMKKIHDRDTQGIALNRNVNAFESFWVKRRMRSNNAPAMPGISNSNFWKCEASLARVGCSFKVEFFYYGDSNVNVYSLMEWNWSENKLFQRSAPLLPDTQTRDMYNFIYFHFASVVWRVWQIDTYTKSRVWVSSNGILEVVLISISGRFVCFNLKASKEK